MGALRRGHRGRRHLNAEVNIINLVDVVLVLLIVFMVTAPMLQGGVEVNLPKAIARPMNSQDALTITVTKDGMIVLEEARVSYDEFAATFPIVVSRKTPTGVFVRGDAGAAYGDVIRVLAVVRESGIQNAGLVVEPAGPR
ncbi:MAG: protein TolR [Gemmatimonadetes bacterium HGW-Gemmatimonadetes-1]|nr:MAG: protein TolR [Gemmatimonadetes bacterium HGW-Gemmatimonadetes-1]